MDTELDALKTACKTKVHKAAEATGEFIGNAIADKIFKRKYAIDENAKLISARKKNKLIKTSIIEMDYYKIFKLLYDSTVSKFVTKNRSK